MPLLDNSLLIVLPGGTLPVGGASPGAVAAIASDLAAETTARQQADTTLDTNRRDAVVGGDIVRLLNTGGTANAIMADVPTGAWFGGITFFTSIRLELIATNTNTGPATLGFNNVAGFTGIPINDADGQPLQGGEIKAGDSYILARRGGVWRILNDDGTKASTKRRSIRERSGRQLARYRRGRGQIEQGQLSRSLLNIGNSLIAGWSVNGVGVHSREMSYPTMLAKNMSALRATSANVMGRAITSPVGYTNYDPRVSWTGGWSPAGVASLGGEAWINSTDEGVWSFDPKVVWNRATIWFALTEAAEVEIGASGKTQRFTPAVGSIVAVNFDAPLAGSQAITIQRVSGPVQFIGMDLRDNRVPGLSVINAGRSGWRSGQYADASAWFSPLNAIAAVNPILTLIELGMNDWNQSYSPTMGNTFATSMQALIDATVAASSDCVLIVPLTPNKTSQAHEWEGFRSTIHELGQINDVPVIDFAYRNGTFAQANGLGIMTDNLHDDYRSIADRARLTANFLLQ